MRIYHLKIDVQGMKHRVYYKPDGTAYSLEEAEIKSQENPCELDIFDPSADDLFTQIQFQFGCYDNSCMESYKDSPRYIIIEGHDHTEMKQLWNELAFFEMNTHHNDLNQSRKIRLKRTLVTKLNSDTIIGNERGQCGELWVRTPEFYDEVMEKILSMKKMLPMLLDIHPRFDELIHEALSNEENNSK